MASLRRKNIVPSRRRRDEDDEEEGSQAGDVDDDSLSEGSAPTNPDDDADAEASDNSDEAVSRNKHEPQINEGPKDATADAKSTAGLHPSTSTQSPFPATTDTAAMMNGLKVSEKAVDVAELNFDDMDPESTTISANGVKAASKPPRRETPAEKKRREHEDYLKEKAENPAFVPTRGGFFLHDDRSSGSGLGGHRSLNTRGRGRGRGEALPIRCVSIRQHHSC